MTMRNASRASTFRTVSFESRSVLMASAAAVALLGLTTAPSYAQSAPQSHAVGHDVLPQNPNVVRGSAGFAADGSKLDVNQSTDRVVIDWRSFDIGRDAEVSFHQPGTDSIAVNRISGGGMPSQIDGMLNANGTVVILNPNGVLFSASSRVDVGGLVASTGRMDIDRFMAGDNRLAFTGATSGAIAALGTINIADAGLAAFVAPHVRNDGVINARLGRVALAAGETFTLDLAGDRLIEIGLGADTPLIENYGSILVEGGRVQLSAAAAGVVVDQVINAGGLVSVASARQDGGAIVLEAAGGGITVDGALDASGATGGGDIRVLADDLTVTGAAVLTAAATRSGDGGFIETSGYEAINIVGGATVNASAVNGAAGTWLIDPVNVSLVSDGGASTTSRVQVSTIEAALANGTSTTVTTNHNGSDAGDLTVAASINANATNGAGLTLTGRHISATGGAKVNINDGGLTLNVNAVNALADTRGAGNWIQDALNVIGTVGDGATLNLGAGVYAAGAVIGTANVTIDGGGVARISATQNGENGLSVNGAGDGAVITGLEIFGQATSSYDTFAWGGDITRGIVVSSGADNVTVVGNHIHDVRNGILIDGRSVTGGTFTDNIVDNTKSAISVQYTNASNLDIFDNADGVHGNEWGIIVHLNGVWDGVTTSPSGGALGAATPLAEQQRLLALSQSNNGLSVYNQAYSASNRTHVNVAVTGLGGAQGSLATPIGTVQGGVDAVVAGGTVNIGAGEYAGLTTINKGLTLLGAGMDETELTGGFSLVNGSPFSGLILQGFTLSGDGGGNALVRNGRVTDLTIDDVRFDGGGVADRHGFAGGQFGGAISITNSEFVNIRGWSAFDTSTSGTATAITGVVFSDNLLDNTVGNITFRQASPTADVTISGNTVRNVGDTTDLSSGVFKVFGAATVDFIGNDVSGVGASPTKFTAGVNDGAALLVRDVGTLNITDNVFTDNQQALLIGAGNALPAETNITGNTFNNNAYDIFLPASAGAGVMNFGAGNTFTSGAATQQHITWIGASGLDLTGVKFNGLLGSEMSQAQLFALEDLIFHGVDSAGAGLATVKADHVFVTGGNAGSLRRALGFAGAGDTVNVGDGSYALNAWLLIDDSISLIGQSQAGTILDATGSAQAVIKVQADDVALSNFTVLGGNEIGIKVEASGPGGADARRNDFAISDVTITGSRRTGLDLNAVVGAVIDGVTVTGVTNGNGMAITDSADVTVRDSHTSNNAWGGLALYQTNGSTGSNQQLTGITVDASNSFGEAAGLYMQDGSALHDIGALTIGGFDHIVHESATSTVFQRTLSDAQAFALTKAAGSSIEGWTGTGGSNAFTVINGLQINNAVRDVRSGGVISIHAGDYSEGASLSGRNYGLLIAKDNLTLQGVDANGDVITDARDVGAWITALARSPFEAHHYITGSNVTIQGLGFAPMAGSSGKTVEVTGDAFTLRNSVIDNTGSGADINLYISGFTNNSGAPWSTVESFTIQDNIFTSGDLGQKIVVVGAGVGLSADASQRLVSGNIFNGNGQAVESGVHVQGLISSQAWQARRAGAVTIADNTFNDVALAVRSVGGLVDGLDWKSIFEGNAFTGGAVLAYVGNTDQARAGTLTLGGVDVDDTFISRTIQAGVNQAQAGDTVRVAAGDYADQNIVINRSLSLLGANAGVNAANGDGSAAPGGRGAESVLTGNGAVSPGTASGALISVTANDVTIDGFAFTGGNGRIIMTGATADNLAIVNNVFDTASGHDNHGIINPHGRARNLLIANNLFSGEGGAGWVWLSDAGQAGALNGVTIRNNDFTGVSDTGVFQAAGPFAGFGFLDNYVGSGQVTGINLGHLIDPLIANNRFVGVQYAAMQIGVIGGGAIRDNLIDGTGSGYDWGSYTAANGIQIWGGAYGTPSSEGLVIEGNTIQNYAAPGLGADERFVGVSIGADAGPNLVVHDNTLRNNSVGLRNQSNQVGLTLTSNRFITAADGLAIVNAGPALVDVSAGANSINGVTIDNATIDQLFEIEALIGHRIDDAAYGFVNIRDHQLFATATAGNLGRAVGLATAGDTVNVANGDHVLSSTLEFFTDGVSLVGQSRAGVIIDASGAGAYGVRVKGDDVSLSGFTLTGGVGYGVKVEADGPNGADERNTGFSIADVAIRNSAKTGLDLNAVTGATIDGVTVTGVSAGNGISITDSADVTVSGVTTSGNAWAGLGLFQRNNVNGGGSNQQLTGIVIDGSNSFGETDGVYLQAYATALHGIGDLTIEGFDYAIRNNVQNPAGDTFVWFRNALQDAFDKGVNVAGGDFSVVRGWDGSGYDGNVYVGIGDLVGGGTRALSIQTAFNASGVGDTVSIASGDYGQTAVLTGRRNVRFGDVSLNGLTFTAGAAGSGLSGSVTARDGVHLAGPVILLGDTTLVTTGGDIALAGVNALASGAAALTLDGGTGAVSLGRVGDTAALAGLSVTGGDIVTVGATTRGAQSYVGSTVELAGGYTTSGANFTVSGASELGGDATVATTGGDATFGAVDGAHALSVNAGEGDIRLGKIGSKTALAGLTVTGDGIRTAGATTRGGQSYTGSTVELEGGYTTSGGGFTVIGATTLVDAASVATNGGDIRLASIDGARTLALDAGDGAATLGAAGSKTALAGLSVTGADIAASGAKTSGAQAFNGVHVRLAGDYSTAGGGFSLIGLTTLDGPVSIGTSGGAATLGRTQTASTFDLDVGQGTATLDSVEAGGAVTVTGRRVVLTGDTYAGARLTFLGDAGSTVRLTRVLTTFDTTRSPTGTGDITFRPNLVGATDGAQSVAFVAGSGQAGAADGDVSLQNVGTQALRLGAMTVTGGDLSAQTVKLAGDYTATLSGDQAFSAHTLDTLGTVNARIAGDESGPIVAGGSVTIVSGGTATGSLTAGGAVNITTQGDSSRTIVADGPVNLVSGGGISGSIISGGDVRLDALGSIVSSVTTPTALTINSSHPVNMTVDAGAVTVNAPGGKVDGVFRQISTSVNGAFSINGQTVIGSGDADASQFLITQFLAPVGGVVGRTGEIQLPVNLALALFAPAGEGQGNRLPIVVNSIDRLGELLRLGYTAIIVELDQGDSYEQELDIAVEGEGQPVG